MSVRVLHGDCLDVLRTLPDASVHCCVTSPPYWGLRDYGTAEWEGGDAECDHRTPLGGNGAASAKQVTSAGTQGYQARDICGKCGARRIDRQIGLEATPTEYVAKMVEVFREVRRVLRDDGTLFLNLGDSYASAPSGSFDSGGRGGGALQGGGFRSNKPFDTTKGSGFKPKDLMMIPARVALALQSDGWWLRSDIIWHKPNPMPESVTDRPTSAHEHVFLLAKSPRYFFDAEAVREEAEYGEHHAKYQGTYTRHKVEAMQKAGATNGAQYQRGLQQAAVNPLGRNLRNVWTIATAPYSEAHFATFPPDLAERCIKAGTSERGCCVACGAPWVRVVERDNPTRTKISGIGIDCDAGTAGRAGDVTVTTTGWSASCQCDAATEPATVLDPFGGAGTTGLVADRLGRSAILIELNPEYADMARNRITRDAGMFASVA